MVKGKFAPVISRVSGKLAVLGLSAALAISAGAGLTAARAAEAADYELTAALENETDPEQDGGAPGESEAASCGILALTAESAAARPGADFSLDIAFNKAVIGNVISLKFIYDPDILALAGFTPAAGLTAISDGGENAGSDRAERVLAQLDGAYSLSELGRARFTVSETAADGAAEVSVLAEYVVLGDDGSKAVETASARADIAVAAGIPGDVDGDGALTLIDLSDLIDAFGLASSDDGWGDVKAFDFNDSEDIDIYDVSYVTQLLTGPAE
ncbi:MAG: hypothetical protein LBD92_05755 [Oscillospiraceae bacterium]|jgi:hypothetical protein|nr:hypothetical protein [Oscillospiraceae bacterium]